MTAARVDAAEPEDAARPARFDRRMWRRSDIRIFSSASDAPRARRPTDLVLLVLAILVVVGASFVAPGPTAFDEAVSNVVRLLPGLFGWFWEISYDALIGWAIVLLSLALFCRGRKRLLLDEVLAGAVALGIALVVGRIAGTAWSTSLKALSASGPPAIFLAVRLATATAIVVAASPHLSRPLRYVGRWVIGVGAVAGIALGVVLPVGLITGFTVGIGSAALVHLVRGSPGGRLTLAQVGAALSDLGVAVRDLRYAPLEPSGIALATASTLDGDPLVIKIYGRDAWEGQLLASAWTSVWNRGESPRIGMSRLQQVEHEAFVTLLAERGGVPVLPVVVAGLAGQRDAVLVLRSKGRRLAVLTPAEVDDTILARLWGILTRLRALGVAHGQVDANRLEVAADGSVAIGDFGDAQIAAPDPAMLADQAQLLVATALIVGNERAVSAAAEVLGAAGIADVLPFLQPAALDRAARRSLRERGLDVDDLRKIAAQHAGMDPPALEQLRRVSVRSVVIVLLVAFLAYTLISALAGVGLQNLADELKQASPAWLCLALILSPIVQVAQAFSTVGASLRPVRFGPVLMLQYGIQFIGLAVPSSAARVALEIRFFERVGVEAGGAVSIGLIDSVCGFLVQVLLILGITLSGLASLAFGSSGSSADGSSGGSSGGRLLLLAAALVVLGGLTALAIPKYRRVIRESIPRYRAAVKGHASAALTALRVLRSPSKLGLIFGGNLVAQLLEALILGVCLRAFGWHATFAELILVNTFVSMFAGFMPVPGGMGVAEAGFTAGLVALGIPNTVAVSTAVAFRMATFYLPPLWGSVAMRWLRAHSYI
jgi:uncharacterized membrane protein YbhN (UPF0104 family)